MSLILRRKRALSKWSEDGETKGLYETGVLSDCCQCCKATIRKEVETAVQNEIIKMRATLSNVTNDGVSPK